MQSYPCDIVADHLVVELREGPFLLDTGSPVSVAKGKQVTVGGETFPIGQRVYGVLSADKIAELVGHPLEGLIGGDLLNRFDTIIDLQAGTCAFSTGVSVVAGEPVPLRFLMGVPKVQVEVGGQPQTLFLDTGATVTYVSTDLASFPEAGVRKDFYPYYGSWSMQTYRAPVTLGDVTDTLQCAHLPALLGMSLKLGGADGILGLEVFRGRQVGYFPRRSQLVLGPSVN